MTTIYEALQWNDIQVTAHAAAQHIPLKYGEAGAGGTRVTLIAGTHGDEGPWSARDGRDAPERQVRGHSRGGP
jgi:hypothetical protein